MGSLTDRVADLVREAVARWPAQPTADDLSELLRLLGLWRSRMLANTYMVRQGRIVGSGPFKGMDYVVPATEGVLVARLLGTYEAELHPHLLAFAAEELDCVIDVGCAEGYYAVGLARLMPKATVYAYDIDPRARAACALMAEGNGVADRVVIGERMEPDGFEAFAGRRALVLVDAEGAELDILRPDLSPALATMRLIVETHDVYRRGAYAEIRRRFAPTHHLERVDLGPRAFDAPQWLLELNHLDQLLATWEWRREITPWLVMRPKAG